MKKPPVESQAANVGFISTRLSGMDGVSLEAEKWAGVLERHDCRCFYFAGELDRPRERSLLVEEAHFKHPEVLEIQRACFGRGSREEKVTRRIHRLREKLKKALRDFIERFDLHLLIIENALSVPLNLPLGLAIAELLSETGIPAIGHHHDFYWERPRLLVGAVWEYINMAFPPTLPTIRHVVINSSAQHQLSLRTGAASVEIPNVIDFENPPQPPDEYASDLRETFGVGDDELFVLQPTRVVARKGIEHSIELVRRLDMPAKLVISHASGDEELEYEQRVRAYSDMLGVQTVFVAQQMDDERGRTPSGEKIYCLGDVYPHADLVTYPSTKEGFGNAFIETIYYRKPIVVNTYTIYTIDIKPKGFQVIELEHYVTEETVRRTKQILSDEKTRREMVEHNYELGRRYYSFAVLEKKLRTLLSDCLGR